MTLDPGRRNWLRMRRDNESWRLSCGQVAGQPHPLRAIRAAQNLPPDPAGAERTADLDAT